MASENKPKTSPKKGNKIIFNSILVLFPLIILLVIELILRITGYGDNLNLFVNHPDKEYKEYKIVNPEIGKKYFQRFEYSNPPKDIFLKKKDANSMRIFVMGSSTVVGFPYDNNLMFSRILHEWLREAYPGKKIEVINTAITAINSFTLLDYMPQVLAENPDAILFYAGHNEFYGAFGAGSNEAATHNSTLIGLHFKLMNLKIYQLTRNIISGVAETLAKNNTAAKKRGTLMSRIVKDADITYNSDIYKKGIADYEKNLSKILSMAQNKDVPVFISNLVSNVRDLQPFKSLPDGDLKPAIDYYKKAQQLEANGEYNEAKKFYTLARDYDCIRFRASSDINTLIEKLAQQHKAQLVNTLHQFEINSPNGLVGNNLLTEHVHPNIEGYFIMAESFYKALVSSSLFEVPANPFAARTAQDFMLNYGFTELDYLVGLHRVTNLSYHWPFKEETGEFIDYRVIYKPSSTIDSLAFNVMVSKEESMTDAHQKLAKIHEKSGNIEDASREYLSVALINPYWPANFRKVGDLMLYSRDLPNAQKYYSRSLEYGEESFYAHFRLGEIFLIKNELDKAIAHFEKAHPLADKEKLNILSKLYIAYFYKRDRNGAERVAADIKNLKGRIPNVPPQTYSFLDYVPIQVEEIILEASGLLKEAKTAEAEQLFLGSLAIRDNHIAHRRLGEIYSRNQDMQKALYHLKKVYNDFDTDPKFLHVLTITYLGANNLAEATKCFQQIKEIAPNYNGIETLNQIMNNYN
jgi:tetratricopeptide (TPR) repeat protein/lysophospholipase L1-like esterase